jgi:DNA-binding protein
MENYTRVPKAKDPENISANEIRITSTGRTRRYISYSVALLDPTLLQHDDEDDKEQKEQQKDQKIYDLIVLKGMGQAINKTVTIAEVIKRRVAGLHQLNEIHSTTITDEWEPKEEGLEKHSTTRTVSAISITLSKKPLNVKDPGYQAPIAADLIQPMQPALPRKKKSEEAPATSSEWNSEEQPQQEKPKPKKKTQRKKKQPADKKKKTKENDDQQPEQQQQQEQGEVAAEKPKSDRPKKPRNRKPRAETSSEQKSEETGDNQQSEKTESSTRGGARTRGRGGKRYRGGYKKNRDSTNQGEATATTSDNQTE